MDTRRMGHSIQEESVADMETAFGIFMFTLRPWRRKYINNKLIILTLSNKRIE